MTSAVIVRTVGDEVQVAFGLSHTVAFTDEDAIELGAKLIKHGFTLMKAKKAAAAAGTETTSNGTQD